MNNADYSYRPLVGGVSVMNARIAQPGTLGCLARDAAGLWLISNYHVLCDVDMQAFGGEEAIYQPAAQDPGGIVATTKASKGIVDLDCAAALLSPGITGVGLQLGLGKTAAPAEPVAGMRVVKSGALTGVTEGVITAVNGDDVTVEPPPEYDPQYAMSLPGDSGSVWLEQGSLAPVALHCGHVDPRKVRASRFLAVLAALDLEML